MVKKFSEQQIIESWQKNARPWISAVRQGEIESRLLATNQAIVDAVLNRRPQTVLDVGCGEGWLIRELAGHGINALGVDVVSEFVEIAGRDGRGRFRVLPYAAISADSLEERFDVVVCNFSLLGKDSVDHLLRQLPALMNDGAALIVQTLHPVVACGDLPYQDGWRQGSWAGFSGQFVDPAPWYFRTIESWQALLVNNGFNRLAVQEPLNPKTQTPASIVFVAERAD